MKEKHTPGPWTVENLGRPGCHIAGNNNANVCGVTQPRPYAVIYSPIDAEISKANARLIAAAPDMLKALRRLIDPAEMADISALVFAEDVIAEATGNTQ